VQAIQAHHGRAATLVVLVGLLEAFTEESAFSQAVVVAQTFAVLIFGLAVVIFGPLTNFLVLPFALASLGLGQAHILVLITQEVPVAIATDISDIATGGLIAIFTGLHSTATLVVAGVGIGPQLHEGLVKTLELTVDLTQVITLNLEHRAGRERREQRQSED